MKKYPLTETDYYCLELEVLHPPAKELTQHDLDFSSEIKLRKKSADGEDDGLVKVSRIKDSELINRANLAKEQLFGKRSDEQAIAQQKTDIFTKTKKMAEKMCDLEEEMQQKLDYYEALLPDLEDTVKKACTNASTRKSSKTVTANSNQTV